MDVATDPTAGRPAGSPSGSGLSERERELLAFERQWWKFAGAKEQAIRELFDMSATRYYQVLNALIDRPDALEFDPMLVKRLRRHARLPSARTLGAAAGPAGLNRAPAVETTSPAPTALPRQPGSPA